ncbi:hypothetical protein N3K66_005370 [Trichothecium roseum]|uniref:Uncharacterized protein n=1 Tax=Trichothecium roseum TaxID=47278 RepID=A0ACC0UYY9_9HYPO|nr:hypothetical protein N3K66_005370 [Trichothecium roseum]
MARVVTAGLGDILHNPPQEQAKVDVVFVHGLHGDRVGTWTYKEQDNDPDPIFWPRDLLPDVCPNARVLSFGYNARVAEFIYSGSEKPPVPPRTGIDDHSIALLDSLQNLRAETQTACPHFIQVLGGLVCANAIGQQHGEGASKKSIVDKVRGIIFLGTPFAGAKKATLALLVTQFLRLFTSTNEKKLEDLDERSEKLFKIGDEFLKVLWARRCGDAPIEVAFYHEELMTKRHRVSLGFIVDSASAIPRGFTGIGIQANHSGMCKFSGKEVDGFISISGHLRQWIEDLDKIADNNEQKEAGISIDGVELKNISNVNGVVTGVIASTKEHGANITGQKKITFIGASSEDAVKRALQD